MHYSYTKNNISFIKLSFHNIVYKFNSTLTMDTSHSINYRNNAIDITRTFCKFICLALLVIPLLFLRLICIYTTFYSCIFIIFLLADKLAFPKLYLGAYEVDSTLTTWSPNQSYIVVGGTIGMSPI